jgi:hypothetical protein
MHEKNSKILETKCIIITFIACSSFNCYRYWLVLAFLSRPFAYGIWTLTFLSLPFSFWATFSTQVFHLNLKIIRLFFLKKNQISVEWEDGLKQFCINYRTEYELYLKVLPQFWHQSFVLCSPWHHSCMSPTHTKTSIGQSWKSSLKFELW